MFKKIALFSCLTLAAACTTVPITGRRQLSLVPDGQVLGLAEQQYKEVLDTSKVVKTGNQLVLVRRVGQRVQQAVETYFRQQNQSQQLAGYQWEFNLIQSPEQNAWCMPGGKVVVYTGILPITQDENGLAVVLGHEIAHAVAKHGSERMSQGIVQQLGGQALNVALANNSAMTRQVAAQAFGVGSQLGLLRYGRGQESEADHLGLIFMAMAGYDPKGAIEFWKRMDARAGGSAQPEFLSTHPSNGTRIADIEQELPQALKYYKPR